MQLITKTAHLSASRTNKYRFRCPDIVSALSKYQWDTIFSSDAGDRTCET